MDAQKVYIAAPFRRYSVRGEDAALRAYGQLDSPERVAFLETIEAVFLAGGWTTCLPHRDEGNWGSTYYPPAAIGALCFRHVATSDLVCAFPGRSRGVAMELGAAHARGIPMLVFINRNEEPSTLLEGLGRSIHHNRLPMPGEIKVIPFDKEEETPALLRKLVPSLTTTPIQEERIGIVDIGSNSLKLSVFSTRSGRRPIPLGKPHRESVSIADEVRNTGRLSQEKLAEVRTVLEAFRSETDSLDAEPRAVGTEALRRARNAADVTKLVSKALGVELRILSQEDEAAAVAKAVRSTLRIGERVASLNLGASSVQIVTSLGLDSSETYLCGFGTKDLTATYPWTAAMPTHEWEAVVDLATTYLQKSGLPQSSRCEFLYHTGGELDFFLRCGVDMQLCPLDPRHVSMIAVHDFEAFALAFSSRDPDDVKSSTKLQGAWLSGSVASNAIALATARLTNAAFIVPSNLNVVDGLLT